MRNLHVAVWCMKRHCASQPLGSVAPARPASACLEAEVVVWDLEVPEASEDVLEGEAEVDVSEAADALGSRAMAPLEALARLAGASVQAREVAKVDIAQPRS
mmetsp:Transcript_91549/g.296176  ORF Transcript_91549/g.296176 Transcript_91549/m.296176 type:complete len:102 (+) Transcript_91549:231-536(+)